MSSLKNHSPSCNLIVCLEDMLPNLKAYMEGTREHPTLGKNYACSCSVGLKFASGAAPSTSYTDANQNFPGSDTATDTTEEVYEDEANHYDLEDCPELTDPMDAEELDYFLTVINSGNDAHPVSAYQFDEAALPSTEIVAADAHRFKCLYPGCDNDYADEKSRKALWSIVRLSTGLWEEVQSPSVGVETPSKLQVSFIGRIISLFGMGPGLWIRHMPECRHHSLTAAASTTLKLHHIFCIMVHGTFVLWSGTGAASTSRPNTVVKYMLAGWAVGGNSATQRRR
ncbi:hypothetical protein CYLTODRAFT_415503 [Cylindrobasidium torrendii FP15055 ss-10]|uniref:Uncharacterized protein n=1 Tax=Cylindrobasidium torrendii FP15055 ss-10 TaxID=1314674 RepID=A0A0D7AT17_9AGAR|nr:hypothetical protein CYLTODRAFT_415503 [Cylindrobasidium torrendii FP15055 ss-10]